MKKWIFGISAIVAFIWACKKDPADNHVNGYQPTPYELPQISNFRMAEPNPDNPLTQEGVALGHQLFFDTRLSKDFGLSCASCHQPEHGFSDPRRFSTGADGTLGRRQAMSVINLAWSKQFFWDGRAATLEEQATMPIADPIEMHLPVEEAVQRLQNHAGYREKFKAAFGTDIISKELLAKALTQYMKALISYNSPFDKYIRGEAGLSPSAMRGYVIFNNETADCFHCHSTPELMVHPSQIFGNNGMDQVDNVYGFKDNGLGDFTGNPDDNGRFKIPSLRNLTMTAPYMHDGRFQTLDEVIESYNEGPKISPSLDPIMTAEAYRRVLEHNRWGLGLTVQEKEDLKAFLVALSDSTILSNPLFRAPAGMGE